jgi:hypothetical protein
MIHSNRLIQHTSLSKVIAMRNPPFVMSVRDARDLIGTNGAGLGTLIGFEGELTFLPKSPSSSGVYLTIKTQDGGHKTEHADPDAEIYFMQGCDFEHTDTIRTALTAKTLDDLKHKIRTSLINHGEDPINFTARFIDAAFSSITLRTVNGNEEIDGRKHPNMQSVVDHQAAWTTNGTNRLYSGFVTNSMSFNNASKLYSDIDPEGVTAPYDGYIETSLAHTHVIGKNRDTQRPDEGGHVISFTDFKGHIEIMPFNRSAHLITFARSDGSKGLRPAFSAAEQGWVESALSLNTLTDFIESRGDENAPIDYDSI